MSSKRYIRLEYLEYGKYCTRPDGPVEENAKTQVLGYTPGFPKELVQLCQFGTEELTPKLQEAQDRSIVLRSCFYGEKQARVVCRITTKVEAGRARKGPTYNAASYVVTEDDDISPYVLAMGVSLLNVDGITRIGADKLEPIKVPMSTERPTWHDQNQFEAVFLQIIQSLVNGLPVRLLGELSESMFFRFAEAVWEGLPSSVKSVVTFGWGVDGELASSLALSHGIDPIDNGLNINLVDGSYVQAKHRLVKHNEEYFKQDLKTNQYGCGQAFLSLYHSNVELSVSEKGIFNRLSSIDEFYMPLWPSMIDQSSVVVFRRLGAVAQDLENISFLLENISKGQFSYIPTERVYNLEESADLITRILLNKIAQSNQLIICESTLWALLGNSVHAHQVMSVVEHYKNSHQAVDAEFVARLSLIVSALRRKQQADVASSIELLDLYHFSFNTYALYDVAASVMQQILKCFEMCEHEMGNRIWRMHIDLMRLSNPNAYTDFGRFKSAAGIAGGRMYVDWILNQYERVHEQLKAFYLENGRPAYIAFRRFVLAHHPDVQTLYWQLINYEKPEHNYVVKSVENVSLRDWLFEASIEKWNTSKTDASAAMQSVFLAWFEAFRNAGYQEKLETLAPARRSKRVRPPSRVGSSIRTKKTE